MPNRICRYKTSSLKMPWLFIHRWKLHFFLIALVLIGFLHVVGLAIFHTSLLLTTKDNTPKKLQFDVVYPREAPPSVSPASASPTAFAMLRFRFDAPRRDSSGMYVIYDDVLKPSTVDEADEMTPSTSVVCLALQSSIDRLPSLVEVAQSWDGPISLALYLRNETELRAAQAYMELVSACFDVLRLSLSLHIVTLSSAEFVPPFKDRVPFSSFDHITCGQHAIYLKPFAQTQHPKPATTTAMKRLLFPQNHMRNVARDGCQRAGYPYFFLTDVDIVPKPNMAADFTNMVARLGLNTSERAVFVVPTYEMHESIPLPQNKAELLDLVRRGDARPFHKVIFVHNQHATNHSYWEHLPPKADLEPAYTIPQFEFFYEPFYVATYDVPRHDERFVGYGFTRNTQVYEAYVAGYQFWVLNNAFAVHHGISTKNSRGYWREKQNAMNRRVYQVYRKELFAKYPNSTRLLKQRRIGNNGRNPSIKKMIQNMKSVAPNS